MSGVVELTSSDRFRPDVAELARRQLASARRRLGLTPEEMARCLGGMVEWPVTAEAVTSWETTSDPPGSVLIAADLLVQHGSSDGESLGTAGADALEQIIAGRFADVDAVFASRSAFSSAMPPHDLFAGARDISLAGLSLNLICQQTSGQTLVRLIEDGAQIRCLFLSPSGESIRRREEEEGYPTGHLAGLTAMNIRILDTVRDRIPEELRTQLAIATYDEPIRFNIVLIDDRLCVVQPYLTGVRGVDSPTFLLRRRTAGDGLFPAFRGAFAWLWKRSTPVP